MKANGVDMFGAPVDVISEVDHGNTLIKGTSWKADATSLQLTVRREGKGRGRGGEGEGKGCVLEGNIYRKETGRKDRAGWKANATLLQLTISIVSRAAAEGRATFWEGTSLVGGKGKVAGWKADAIPCYRPPTRPPCNACLSPSCTVGGPML